MAVKSKIDDHLGDGVDQLTYQLEKQKAKSLAPGYRLHMDAEADHLIIGAQMVCNRATSPSSSQRGQLSPLRNKFSLQPDQLEFNLAAQRENLNLFLPQKNLDSLLEELHESRYAPKTSFLWTESVISCKSSQLLSLLPCSPPE